MPNGFRCANVPAAARLDATASPVYSLVMAVIAALEPSIRFDREGFGHDLVQLRLDSLERRNMFGALAAGIVRGKDVWQFQERPGQACPHHSLSGRLSPSQITALQG